MKKQYFHQMNEDEQRFTAVVEVPTKEEMAQILSLTLFHKTEVKIKCGLTIVNPKDKHYIKKLGRQIADSRMEEFKFELNLIQNDGKYTIIQFETTDETCPIWKLNFECTPNRNKIYLIDVVLY